jgi:ABC-type nitrate/sulfonate/bicarbonate transport system permease component
VRRHGYLLHRDLRRVVETTGAEVAWIPAAAPIGLFAPALRRAGVQRVVASTHGQELGWLRVAPTREALRRVARSLEEASSDLGASGWQTFIKLRLPNALPHIFTGLKTSLTFALTGVIVAEFLTGAADGLGRLVQVYNLQIQVDRELGVVLIVTTLGIAGVTLLDRLHRRIVFWRTDDEQTPAGYQ